MSQVTRITHRRANTDTSHEYEQLIRGMLDDCSKAKGYLFSTLIPPRTPDDEFHIVQTFASQADLDEWHLSHIAHGWHEKIDQVSKHPPEYRIFNTTDLWFSTTGLTAAKQPDRWRMAFVIWMGIFPIASFYVWFLFPFIAHIPFIPRMFIFTSLIVMTMFYGVLPHLLKGMAWFLRR